MSLVFSCRSAPSVAYAMEQTSWSSWLRRPTGTYPLPFTVAPIVAAVRPCFDPSAVPLPSRAAAAWGRLRAMARIEIQFKTVVGRHGTLSYLPNDMFVGRSLELYGEFSEQET